MRKYSTGHTKPTQKPILKELAENTGIPLIQAHFVYDTLWHILLKKLKDKQDVILPGIGRLQFVPVVERKSNLTGQIIPEHKKIRFNVHTHLGYYLRVNTRIRPIQ